MRGVNNNIIIPAYWWFPGNEVPIIAWISGPFPFKNCAFEKLMMKVKNQWRCLKLLWQLAYRTLWQIQGRRSSIIWSSNAYWKGLNRCFGYKYKEYNINLLYYLFLTQNNMIQAPTVGMIRYSSRFITGYFPVQDFSAFTYKAINNFASKPIKLSWGDT